MVRLLDLEVSGKAIGYIPAVSVKSDSAQYDQLLDRWAVVAARRKIESPSPKTEERQRLESRYLTTIYDSAKDRADSFVQLKYDLGDATVGEVREMLEKRLGNLLNVDNLKKRWEGKGLLLQENIDKLVAYLDNRVFGTGNLPQAYINGMHKPSVSK